MSSDGTSADASPGAVSSYPVLDAGTAAEIDRLLLQSVRVAHGDRLSPAALSELEACVASQSAAARALHTFPLTNADEPAFVQQIGQDAAG